MNFKALFVLPLMALGAAMAAAKPAPAPEAPTASVVAPADVAANPANRLTLDLSNGKSVVIQLRPDNIIPAFEALAALGYQPRVPVTAEEFATAVRRCSEAGSGPGPVRAFRLDTGVDRDEGSRGKTA